LARVAEVMRRHGLTSAPADQLMRFQHPREFVCHRRERRASTCSPATTGAVGPGMQAS